MVAVVAVATPARAQAPAAWLPDSEFQPITLRATGQPVRDETGDQSPGNVDVSSGGNFQQGTVGPMSSLAFGYDPGNAYLYFRMLLSGSPLALKSGAWQVQSQGSWVFQLDTDRDDQPDWTVSLTKDGAVKLFQGASTIPTRSMAVGAFTASGPVYRDSTDGGGYVRVADLGQTTAMPDPTGPHALHTLDVRVPLAWLTGMTATTVFRPYFGTSANDNNINKDYIGTGIGDITPIRVDLDQPGALYDARDPAPSSNGGTWRPGESVQLTGYGWPSGISIPARIHAPDGATVVFTGTLGADANGDVAATATWQVPGDAAPGIYHVLAEFGGSLAEYDTFTVASASVSVGLTGPATALAGGPVDYTLTARNGGTEAAQNVVAQDAIPAGTHFRAGSVSAAGFSVEYLIGGSYTAAAPATQAEADGVTGLQFTLDGNLDAGAERAVSFGVIVSSSLTSGATVSNVATLDHQNLSGTPGSTLTSPTVVTTIQGPAIGLTKSVELRDGAGQAPNPPRATATVGDVLAYTVQYSNTGSAEAQSLTITDRLPAGVALKVGSVTAPAGTTVAYSDDGGATWAYAPAANAAGVDPRVNAVRWTWTESIAAGAGGSVSLQAVVQPGVTTGAVLRNTATADFTNAAGLAQGAPDAHADISVAAPGVLLEPDRSAEGVPGTAVVFAHTVANQGVAADTFNLTASGTQGWTVALYRDANGDGALDAGDAPLGDTNGDGVPDTGAVAAGASLAILAQVQVPANADGLAETITLTARSAADGSQSDTATDRLTARGTPALGLQKYIGAPGATTSTALPGETIAYGIVCANTGTAAANSVVFSDALPAWVRYVAGSARLNGAPLAADPYDAASRTLSVPVGSIAAGASATVTFQVVVE